MNEDTEIDLRELLSTLWRGKFRIALFGVMFALIGGYYAFSVAVPKYRATATIALESRQDQVVDIESVVTGLSRDVATINTEAEVLKSRELIRRLVEDLDLTNDPVFNPALRPTTGYSLEEVVASIKSLIRVQPTVEPPPSHEDTSDNVVDGILKSLSVSQIRASYVFNVSITSVDRERAMAVTNRLAELYVEDQIRVKYEKTQQATIWLSEQVTDLRIQLEAAETELKAFDSESELISPEGLVALNRQLKDLRDRREAMIARVADTQARADALTAVKDRNNQERASVTGDAALRQTANRIAAGNADLQTTFERQFQVLLTRAVQDANRGTAQLDALSASISELQDTIDLQSDELVRLQQLQRESEANRLIYEAFLSRLKETSIQTGIQQADSRILSPAILPKTAVSPRKSRVVALSLLLGLMLGAAIVLMREMMQNKFRSAEDVESITGVSVIGEIPLIPAKRRKNLLNYLIEKPNSQAAEAIRNLRTSLLLADLDKPPQVIMSTSSIPAEGKTTQSVAMAQNLAGLDKKVLLIEGDIRRRVFREYFESDQEKGLLSILSGSATLDEVVHASRKTGTDVLFGEKSKVNAADIFSSSKFNSFLEGVRKRYDYIIIDTPPVLVVPDARVIAQNVDAIMYSVRWDGTSRRQVLDGLRLLDSVNAKVSGVVLSQIDQKAMKRYGYGDRYGNYSQYYNA